jgi:hypothetical protein
MDLPAEIQELDQMPPDFHPQPLGLRRQIIQEIKLVVPIADFSDPSWGRIDGDDWSIEVNLGDEEICDHFAFHVRGGDTAAGVVAAILEKLRLRALDSGTGNFFVPGEQAIQSFNTWKSYRDDIVGR